MKIPGTPNDEAERQCALDNTGLIASGADPRFDRITRMVSAVFSVPITLVSLIDRDRQWFKSRHGLDAEETPREISFCGHAILNETPLIVSDALQDPRFKDNPLVTGMPNIRFYAGAPISTKSGHRIGTLCLIDNQPRDLTEAEVSTLVDFAATVEALIHVDEANHEQAELMELQFISNRDALQLLNSIAFASFDTLDSKVNNALHLAREYLQMDVAIVSQIEGNTYTAAWIDGGPDRALEPGQQFALQDTWCQLLFSEHTDSQISELFISNMQHEGLHSHTCYQKNPVEAYASVILEVEGRRFGSLNFSSTTARLQPFDDGEQALIRLLGRWLSTTLGSSLSNERVKKLMAQLPGVTYQFRRFPDGKMTFPFSSPQIEVLYGLTPSQAALDASPAFARIHPDDLDTVSASIEQSASSLEYWNATYRVSDRQGHFRWISGNARPERLIDGSILWHGYLQDIHEHEQARRGLKRNEARLRGLFELSPIGIALNDYETGAFLDGNPALLKPTGYSKEEFIALSYWDLTPQEYQPQEEDALQSLQTTGRYGPFEKEYIRKDGIRYPVRLQGILSEETDGRRVIWSLIEDISERRKLDQMKDQFIATVSHELRTPLTSIKGSLGLLAGGAMGKLPPKATALLTTAERNAQRLNALINDLLDMEKLVAGKMPMNLTIQPLGDLLDESIDSMQNYFEQHRVSISTPQQWPAMNINVDGPRFIQALTNLLSNAAKYSPEQGHIEIAVRAIGMQTEIAVRDHGPGVPVEFRHQLFKRFSQADSSDSRKLPGTGLGLAITQEIAHQMGGFVNYRDAKGGGSEFYIVLPTENNQ
ncbi:ATP-binding protein [Salinispirillum sp. LH 10-3-1]|uniref:histidine kinase n=1 Tax=Salinispirillum sp. LH 10-3-1 TaxID=2952525 RepID=A0AB38YKB5_9GAMM